MSIVLTLKFITALALYVQLLILIYLYSSHRERFFRYMVWAWGLFVVSKGASIIQQFVPETMRLLPLFNAVGSAGDLFILAAGLAYRGAYRVRWPHIALGLAYALVSAFPGATADLGLDLPMARRAVGGCAFLVAGWAFWPHRAAAAQPGARLLAASLTLWGLYRVVMVFVDVAPESSAFVPMHMAYACFYFLSSFAIIWLVLNRARGEVAALEDFNRRLVDGLGEGLELVDGDLIIRHANSWMVHQFGPVVGRRCYEVLAADGRQCPGCPIASRYTMDAPVRLEIDGSHGRRLVLTCSPVRQPDGESFLLELVADITEQERLRGRLGEAERLAAVGELAAGLAHEIRNPLAAILNAATLLEQEEALTADERGSIIDAVKREAHRLNATLSDFLLFARPRAPKLQRGDIRQVVEHVAALLQEEHTRSGGVQVEVRMEHTIPRLTFDPDQLIQVLWNIARNGVEAMAGQGCLALEVARQNGAVVITVADTGPGIPPEDRRRIFQPFFSKKAGGTGLGLAIAQRIVVAHGGRIDVQTTAGQGSQFTICLPVTEG
jgi:signal transduction histidine kinase